MLRLSAQFRHALSRLSFPLMLTASLGVLLIGRADQGIASALRAGVDDTLAPLYAMAIAPIDAAKSGTGVLGHLFTLSAENDALRAENARLRQWQAVALTLEAQNGALKAALHYVPPAAPPFVTGDVVADTGGVYARSVLVMVPTQDGASANLAGAVAMDGAGVAGRVVEAGERAARVLLLTDPNSRIPVAIGPSGAPALMAGNNGPTPSLLYWAPGQPPAEGEVVLTSAEGGAFPPGLPVGVVHYDASHTPVVLPLANLSALRLLRLYMYPETLPELTPVPHTRPVPARTREVKAVAAAPEKVHHRKR